MYPNSLTSSKIEKYRKKYYDYIKKNLEELASSLKKIIEKINKANG
jgi:hypothetical protein